jgi:hypothetical protein
MDSQTAEVTRLLRAWGGGDHGALEQLTPLVYAELHRMAGRYLQRENPGNTLQATALVIERLYRMRDPHRGDHGIRPAMDPFTYPWLSLGSRSPPDTS